MPGAISYELRAPRRQLSAISFLLVTLRYEGSSVALVVWAVSGLAQCCCWDAGSFVPQHDRTGSVLDFLWWWNEVRPSRDSWRMGGHWRQALALAAQGSKMTV